MGFEQENFHQLPPLPPAPAPRKSGNWVVRHKFISGGIAASVGFGIIGAVVGDDSEKEIAAQASTTSTAPTVDQDAIDKAVAEALAKHAASAASQAAPTAGSVSTPEPTPTPTPTPAAPAAPETETDGDTVNFAMPNFVGMNLQDAQDKVQTYGIFFSVSHDLNGSRMQMIDSNWKVCDQNLKPGTKIKGSSSDYEGKIDFGTVKIAENCP